MLALRAISRPQSILRIHPNSVSCIRSPRFTHRSQFHTSTRPNTLSGRLWFRRDGAPRSKIKGLAIAALTSGMLYSIYSMMVIIQEFDTVNYLLACLVHIQRADSEYPSVDFTSATSTLSHFRELCASFGDIPQEMIDDFFGDISRLAGAQGDAAHRIMREVCGLVHNVIAQSKGRDPWETATEVITVLDNAIVDLVELVEDNFSGGDDEIPLRNRRIKDQVTKDTAARSSDYEVVG